MVTWSLLFSGKDSTCQCRKCKRHRFNPWVGNIPWRRKWQPIPVFLPGKFHGQRSLVGCSPWAHRVAHRACVHARVRTHTHLHTGNQFSHSVVPTLCDSMDCSTPHFPVLHQLPSLLKLIFIESVMPSHHLILCHPLLLLPSIFPSIRVFSNESVLHIM